MESPEDLQFYENNKAEIENLLKAKAKTEVKPTEVDLTTAEKMNASQNRYGIVKDGAEAGFIVTTNPENNVVKIKGVTVNEELRGKNIAGEAYVKLAESLAKEGVSLESDSFDKMEPSATRVWEKLADKGLAVKGKNSYQFKPIEETQSASKIKDVYTSNTELSKIGTIKDYSNYVQSIFPDSKVKNVVYHSSNIDFDVFDKNKISSRKEGAPEGGDVGAFGRGIYFTPNLDYSKTYGKNLKSVVLDIKNPKIILNNEANDKLYQNKSIKDLWGDYDSVIYKVTDWEAVSKSGVHSSIEEFNSIGLGKNNKPEVVDIAVDDINKIHILGSNQDVQDFQKWKKAGGAQTKVKPTEEVKFEAEPTKEGEKTLEDIYKQLPKAEKLRKKEVDNLINNNFGSILKQLEKYKIC